MTRDRVVDIGLFLVVAATSCAMTLVVAHGSQRAIRIFLVVGFAGVLVACLAVLKRLRTRITRLGLLLALSGVAIVVVPVFRNTPLGGFGIVGGAVEGLGLVLLVTGKRVVDRLRRRRAASL